VCGEDGPGVVVADPCVSDGVQRALDATEDGDVVYLPRGTHHVTTSVVIPSGRSLVGAGPQVTTVALAKGADCHVFTNADQDHGNENIAVRGLAIHGNMCGQHRPSQHQGLLFACGGYFRHVVNLVVEHVVARSIRQTALHATACSRVQLTDVRTDQAGWSGIGATGTSDLVLQSVLVTNAGLDTVHSGIHINGGKSIYVEAAVETCTGNGIMLDSRFSPLSDVVVEATARRSRQGIALIGGHKHRLSHVLVSGDYSANVASGVFLSNCDSVFIVDSTIDGNGSAGITLQGKTPSRHCVVARSTVTGSPVLVDERNGNRIAHHTPATTLTALPPVTAPLVAT